MENILISDIMTRNPITVEPDTTLIQCARKMVKKKLSSLPVTENKKLVGFISNKDILWALVKKDSKSDLFNIKAKEISPKKVITISPSAKVGEAINKVKKFKFYRIPVVQNGELVGIVTAGDILSFHPEVYSELGKLENIREESAKLKRIEKAKSREAVSDGICEECGERETLYRENGMLICTSCLSSI